MKKYFIYLIIFLLIVITFLFIIPKRVNKNYSVYIEAKTSDGHLNGSGFVYKTTSNSAYIITNYHVVKDFSNIYVYSLKKEKAKAELIGYDTYTDIAVLLIQNTLNLSSVNIGNSDSIYINQKIKVVGSPVGIDNVGSIVKGYIIDINKKINIQSDFGTVNYDAIELKAKVDAGSSGSALIDEKGSVIGIVSLMQDGTDVAYAIPINYVMDVVFKIESGKLDRPNIGATIANSTNETLLNKYYIESTDIIGCAILEIKEGYSFFKAGFTVGDIITKINNISVENIDDMQKELYKYNTGETVNIEFFRNNQYFAKDVSL